MAQRLLWQYTRFKQVCFLRIVCVLECVTTLKQLDINTKECQILGVIIFFIFDQGLNISYFRRRGEA